MQGTLNEKTMHVVCASFVLFSLKSCTHLYNHYRIVEENLLKYMPPDGFFGIQILPNSISARAPPRNLSGSSRHFPRPPSRLGRGHPLPIPTPLDTFGVSPTVPHHFSKPSAAPGANCFISAEFSITL